MNEIAIELGIDPITLRERNLISKFPYKNVLGYTYDQGSYAESLVKIRELLAPDIERARKPGAATYPYRGRSCLVSRADRPRHPGFYSPPVTDRDWL